MKRLILATFALSLGACSFFQSQTSGSGYRNIDEYDAGINETELTRPRSLRHNYEYAEEREDIRPAQRREEVTQQHEEEEDTLFGWFSKKKKAPKEAVSKEESRYEYRRIESDIPIEQGGGGEMPYQPKAALDENNITPNVYKIIATRATNRLLDETASIYENKPRPTIYIKNTIKDDSGLPNGVFEAKAVTREIISGTKSFIITGELDVADYILETSINTVRTEANPNPVLVHRTILLDSDDNVVTEFTESISQTRNDGSWW